MSFDKDNPTARVFLNTSIYNVPWVICPKIFDDLQEKMGWLLESTFNRSTAHEKYLESLSSLPKVAFGIDGDGEPLLPPDVKKTVRVPIYGVLMERLNFWGWLMGGTSTSGLRQILSGLIQDPTVENIILDIDSPGGEIGGIANLAELIFQGREKKNIISVIGSFGASGGCWIACAAKTVYVSAPTTYGGSIGVVVGHRDISEAEKKKGIKTTEVTAGKYKRVVSSHKPLDDEGLQELRAQANKFYQPFVEAISRYRGLSLQNVDLWAEGRVFIGEEIVNIGLADSISSLDSVLETLVKKEGFPMSLTVESLKKDSPEVYQEVYDLGKASISVKPLNVDTLKETHSELYNQVYNIGAETERNRIKAIEAVAMSGFEAIIEPVKYDGKTTGDQVAGMIIREQKQNRGANLQQLQGDSKQASHTTPGEVDETKEIEAMASAIAGQVNK